MWLFENKSMIKKSSPSSQGHKRKKASHGKVGGKRRKCDDYGAEFEEQIDQQNQDSEFQMIDGIAYEVLDKEISKTIEESYQIFKLTTDQQLSYIQVADDIFEIKFSKEMNGVWEILDTGSQVKRRLVRKQVIKGPFKETKSYKWSLTKEEGEGQIKMQLGDNTEEIMTAAYDECIGTHSSVSKFISSQLSKDDYLFCAEYSEIAQAATKTYLVSLDEMRKLPLKRKETVRRWDFLSTLKPPENLSIESGKIWSTVTLAPGSPDYDFVA